MDFNYLIITFFILLNFFFIFFFRNIKIFHTNIDQPDLKRKLHKKPIPLAGGIIIFVNILFYILFVFFNENLLSKEIIFLDRYILITFFLACSAIFFLGFLDDKLNISASKKFLITSILILLILFFDKSLTINIVNLSFFERNFSLSGFSILFTCFCFLVFLNAFNMFDGIDLQSCFYSLIIFSSLLLFYIDMLIFKVFLICLMGYGYLNYKNKSFLGDSGSLLLPFVIGYIFIKLYNINLINFCDEIVIYMLIPGLDLIRLFFKRILQKKNPLSPDRYHLHHLLIEKYSHLKTLLIMVFLILIPIIFIQLNINKLLILIISTSVYFIIISNVTKKL